MITQTTIGKQGRLANQLFQVVFLLGQSAKHGVQVAWPEWKYRHYFTGSFEPSPLVAKRIPERKFNYDAELLNSLNFAENMDFSGYWQSFEYWHGTDIKQHLSFNPEFLAGQREKYAAVFQKSTIAIHIRRGDYVNHEGYVNLLADYYLSALELHFPNWRQQNLLIFSDEPVYAKLHFGCFQNAFFADGNEIEDLAAMSLCQSHIVANSSFSWWGAYLAESSKVVRPKYHFKGSMAGHSLADYYPSYWIEHEPQRIDLKDVTFTIPVSYDHPDRLRNLELTLSMLQKYFDTNFIVMEQGGGKFEWTAETCDYYQFTRPQFHRTRMLNHMAKLAKTPFVVNFDADVILPPSQILEAVTLLRNGVDVAYPYSGRFTRMNRMRWYSRLKNCMDIGIVAGENFPIVRRHDASSTGGAIFFNRESFLQGGGENENLISFGPDDAERFERFTKLGFDVRKVPGAIYHCDHFCGPNSSNRHIYTDANKAEFAKIVAMSKDELSEYIKRWEWVAF